MAYTIRNLHQDLLDLYDKMYKYFQNKKPSLFSSFKGRRYDFFYSSHKTYSPDTKIMILGYNPGDRYKTSITSTSQIYSRLNAEFKSNINRYLDENWKGTNTRTQRKNANASKCYSKTGKTKMQISIRDYFKFFFNDTSNNDLVLRKSLAFNFYYTNSSGSKDVILKCINKNFKEQHFEIFFKIFSSIMYRLIENWYIFIQ